MKKITVLSLIGCFFQLSSLSAKENSNHLPVDITKPFTCSFEENKGQIGGEDASHVKFRLKDGNLSIFLLDSGISYQFRRVHYSEGYKNIEKATLSGEEQKMEDWTEEIDIETYRMDLTLVNANPNPQITMENKSPHYNHYYNKNILNVHEYSKVIYHNIYPWIDWVIYQNEGHVKYDFIVYPGGNPSQIKLRTNWVETLNKKDDGSIELTNPMGNIIEKKPVSFQGNREIPTTFLVENGMISFTLQSYNPSQTLIIDPLLQWSVYYEGNDGDFNYSCTTDPSNNVYIAGKTISDNNIASGGHQNTLGGNYDAFLVKFNTDGQRLWATYYGGIADDIGYSCTSDSRDNIYLTGITSSPNNIAWGNVYSDTIYGNGSFLVKFNSSGVRQWGTYYAGNSKSCVVDSFGDIYLAGMMPIADNSFDAFLAKLDSTGNLLWNNNFGGDSSDYGTSCALDPWGNVYLAGGTYSTNNIGYNGHQMTFGGAGGGVQPGGDAFLAKFNSAGSLQWSTYYGGTNNDDGNSCATDIFGNVYLAGITHSSNNMALGGHQNIHGGYFDGFLVKFDSSGIRQWGTYYGGTQGEDVRACATDKLGNVYLAGTTGSYDNIAANGYQNTPINPSEAFGVKFNSNGIRQWGTYYDLDNIASTYNYGMYCATDTSGAFYLSGTAYDNQIVNVYLAKFDGANPNVGIPEIKANNIAISPNPVTDILYINLDRNIAIEIYSIDGQLIQKYDAKKQYKLNISAYKPGIYFIKANSSFQKFIKL